MGSIIPTPAAYAVPNQHSKHTQIWHHGSAASLSPIPVRGCGNASRDQCVPFKRHSWPLRFIPCAGTNKKMSVFSKIIILILVKLLAFVNVFHEWDDQRGWECSYRYLCAWGRQSWKPTQCNKQIVCLMYFWPNHLLPGSTIKSRHETLCH